MLAPYPTAVELLLSGLLGSYRTCPPIATLLSTPFTLPNIATELLPCTEELPMAIELLPTAFELWPRAKTLSPLALA